MNLKSIFVFGLVLITSVLTMDLASLKLQKVNIQFENIYIEGQFICYEDKGCEMPFKLALDNTGRFRYILDLFYTTKSAINYDGKRVPGSLDNIQELFGYQLVFYALLDYNFANNNIISNWELSSSKNCIEEVKEFRAGKEVVVDRISRSCKDIYSYNEYLGSVYRNNNGYRIDIPPEAGADLSDWEYTESLIITTNDYRYVNGHRLPFEINDGLYQFKIDKIEMNKYLSIDDCEW